MLKDRFGVNRVIWLEGASESDLTEGHVDGIARFIDENTVVVGRYVDQSDPEAELFEDAAAKIRAAGLNVVRLDIPGYVRYRGEWLPANYTNYLVANGVVIASSYGNAQFDRNAQSALQRMFPDRDIIMTDTRELWYHGGAVHCVTNDQPLLASEFQTSQATTAVSLYPSVDQPIVENASEHKSDDYFEMDINQDGKVSAIDALRVLNRLNRSTGNVAAIYAVFTTTPSFDTNLDGEFNALDALVIVNQLRGRLR